MNQWRDKEGYAQSPECLRHHVGQAACQVAPHHRYEQIDKTKHCHHDAVDEECVLQSRRYLLLHSDSPFSNRFVRSAKGQTGIRRETAKEMGVQRKERYALSGLAREPLTAFDRCTRFWKLGRWSDNVNRIRVGSAADTPNPARGRLRRDSLCIAFVSAQTGQAAFAICH